MVDCGLIEVPAYTATAAKGLSDNLVAAAAQPVELSTTSGRRATGSPSSTPRRSRRPPSSHRRSRPPTVQADRISEAYEAAGSSSCTTRTPASSRRATPPRLGDEGRGRRVRHHGVGHLRDRQAPPRHEDPGLRARGDRPRPAVLRPRAARRAGRRGRHRPAQHRAVRGGRRLARPSRPTWRPTTRSARKIEPTSLGVQAFSAGLLFATAAKAARRRPHPRQRARRARRRSTSGTAAASTSWPTPATNTVVRLLHVHGGQGRRVRAALARRRSPRSTATTTTRFDLEDDYGGGAKLKAS